MVETPETTTDGVPTNDPRELRTRELDPPGSNPSDTRRIADRVRQRLFQQPLVAHRIGRFTVLEELGRGGMGIVYAAYDERLNRKVAVKVLRDDEGPSEATRLRFQREAQAMARLSHPNVVTVHEVGDDGDVAFVAMEFIQGQTLGSWLRTRPPWRDVVEAFVMAGRGLAAAHRAGLIHRDLKPPNMMRSDTGRVKVLDFGLARAIDGDSESMTEGFDPTSSGSSAALSHAVTRPGTVMGTPAYMAPEQFRGEDADLRSDQFSFCVALYEGLYGERPFKDSSRWIQLSRSFTPDRSGEEEQALLHVPASSKVPAALRKVVLRGLRIDPEQRWPSME